MRVAVARAMHARSFMRSSIGGVFLGIFAMAGCTSASTTAAPPGASAREILASPKVFDLDQARTLVQLDAEVDRGDRTEAARLLLPVADGTVEVAVDGDQLRVRDLELDLMPIDVPTTIVPAGIRLTDVRIGIAAPVRTDDAVWSEDGDECHAHAIVSLTWDWSLDTGDDAWPLAQQRIDGIDADLAIHREGEALTFDASLSARGIAWRWADLVMLGNVAIAMHAGAS
jgi:hypothetical protein